MRALLSLLLLALSPSAVLALDVAQVPSDADVANAYAAIPHHRTQFDASSSTAAATPKANLARLFAYTDRGVVLRVQGMQAHGAKDAAGVKRAVAGYEGLIADLRKEQFSKEVAPAQALVVEALQLQQRHLQSRPEGGLVFASRQLSSVPDVRDASVKLGRAYRILMSTFPGEPQRNQASFFDHLCALDFL